MGEQRHGDGAGALTVRAAASARDLAAAHRLFRRRIGRRLVEDAAAFRLSACQETVDWAPLLLLAEVDGVMAGAQLGGLLPAVQLLSLPYTAVAAAYEGRGVYRRLKQRMLAELAAMAAARGLPPPRGNVSEEAPGSAQYARKVGGGIAVPLPLDYVQPAAQGLVETPLTLTFEPLTSPPPVFDADTLLTIVAAVYRSLYRITEPERHPAFIRVAASLRR